MPNIARVLKEEISRIARKEAKVAVAPVRRPSVRARRDVAELKRRLAALEKASRQLLARLAKIEGAQPAPAQEESAAREWISGKGIKSLRRRLGLSQSQFAKLVGVSDQAVYNWESRSGMLKLRSATKASVFAVRGIGAREARRRLEEAQPAKKKGTKRRKPAAKKK